MACATARWLRENEIMPVGGEHGSNAALNTLPWSPPLPCPRDPGIGKSDAFGNISIAYLYGIHLGEKGSKQNREQATTENNGNLDPYFAGTCNNIEVLGPVIRNLPLIPIGNGGSPPSSPPPEEK